MSSDLDHKTWRLMNLVFVYLTPKVPTALLVIVEMKRVEDPPKHARGYCCKRDVRQVLPCTKFLGGKDAPERQDF